MVRGPATTQTHYISVAVGASPPSACPAVGLSTAIGSDCYHTVTHKEAGGRLGALNTRVEAAAMECSSQEESNLT